MVSRVACSDPAAPPRLSASVSPVHQWAGGLIEIEIGEGRAEEVSEVLADGSPVVFDRIVGNKLLTRLPETANGPVSIRVDFGESTVEAGFVEAYGVVPLVAGFLAATISAALAVKWLVAWVSRHGLSVFGWYRVLLAVVVIVLLFTGVL